MTDSEAYIQRLLEANLLREPLLRSVIQALRLPPGSRGLDAGCGIGLQSMLLAQAVVPGGHVTGLDVMPDFLLYAENLVKSAGLSEQITFQTGDINNLPFGDDSFDWVWSADCAGYPAGDLLPTLREFKRVVKPGGTVVILAWTAQNLLPGHPLLEARLNASCSAYAPYLEGISPEKHFLRALRWFGEAGFKDIEGRTFTGNIQAPLGDDLHTALLSLFDMLWGIPQPGAASEDLREYQRLCRSESQDCILNLPEYYAFFTYSTFRGKVAG